MSQFFAFGFQVATVVGIGTDFNRDLLDNFQPVALEPDNFPRIIREQADFVQAQIDQYIQAMSFAKR